MAVVDDTYDSLIKNLDGLTDENVPDNLRETYDAAKNGRFIIDDEFDELLDLSTKRNIVQYGKNSLDLTIAPTLGCNFKCIYCYETSKQGVMSENVQQKLVDFVEKQSCNLKHLNISWYGGEPLLALDVIYSLSEEFISICENKNIKYSASIISNGSLLTNKIINKLINYKIGGIQITIDGPPKIHDSRRVNKMEKARLIL